MTGAVRRLTPADGPALAVLDASAFETAWDLGNLRTLLAGDLILGWGIDDGTRLVAALLLRCVAGEGEVLRLAVAPDRRREGLARALLRMALVAVGADLPHGLFLEVRASNSAAQRLYAAEGFREVGRRRGYYVAPVEDAVLMRWPATADPARQGSLAPAGSRW